MDTAFSYEFLMDLKRLFIAATEVVSTGTLNEATGLSRMQLKNSQRVISMLSLTSQYLYLVPLEVRERNQILAYNRMNWFKGDSTELAGGDLLYVNQDDIGFM